MSEKTMVKLNMGERFHILSLLPSEGDYTTIKILRKLRETLAPDEKENSEYEFQQDYRCPHVSYGENGRREQCEYNEISASVPTCPVHNRLCVLAGKLFWTDELAGKEKEIWLGNKARSMIVDALKQLSDNKQLKDEDGTAQLYEKFVQAEEIDD